MVRIRVGRVCGCDDEGIISEDMERLFIGVIW